MTREPNYSKVSRIRFVYQKQILGDWYEKDYSRCPELCGSFGSHTWNFVCVPRYGVLQAPRYGVLQKPGYAMLPVNASERLFPF